MIRSMTGFGQAEGATAGWRCTVELRSVNGRYLDVRLRLPSGLTHLDEPLKKRIKARCERGKLDGTVTLAPEGEGATSLKLNLPLLRSYARLLRDASGALEHPLQVSLGDLLANRDLVQLEGWESRQEAVEALVGDTLERALAGLADMRRQEGDMLRAALLEHVAVLRRLVADARPLTSELPAHYARRLRENLAKLGDGNVPGEERILQEITLFADRCDVTEEFARLETHLHHLTQLLEQPGAVGRKIEFLLQEVNREANTLAVKSSDAQVSALVVDMKAELEKLREQVQNIE